MLRYLWVLSINFAGQMWHWPPITEFGWASTVGLVRCASLNHGSYGDLDNIFLHTIFLPKLFIEMKNVCFFAAVKIFIAIELNGIGFVWDSIFTSVWVEENTKGDFRPIANASFAGLKIRSASIAVIGFRTRRF